jgi:hypothetical protein
MQAYLKEVFDQHPKRHDPLIIEEEQKQPSN